MKLVVKRLIALMLGFLVVIGNLSTYVYADQTTSESDSTYVNEGTFQYTSNENFNKQETNNYLFREDCFTRSSFDGCCHLGLLSSQVAIASASRYGDAEDQYEVQTENNSINVRNMLKSMGFKDVKNNTYYDKRQLENSTGVVIGHRPIKVNGKEYTLLAIVPRSAGYKQEWVGDFTVDDDDIHSGFKAARDEVLRYVKQYIEDNKIQGELKVWTVGHSRGAAIANMLGGFFAGGGIEYFDGKVSITPEDVYCYTYATPKTIKKDLSKNIELSVSGSREAPYDSDTPGDAFTYTGGGSVDPGDSVYGGIRNFLIPYDVITMLPPESWGYTYYGGVTTFGEDDCVTIDDIQKELGSINTYVYFRFMLSGNPELFKWYTFNLEKLEMVESEAEHSYNNMADFMKARIGALTHVAPTSDVYLSSDYQNALKAVAGLYGMLLMYANDIQLDEIKLPDGAAKALFFMLMAYAAERLEEEWITIDVAEATTTVLCSLISEFTGEDITPENTADDLVKLIAKFISDNEDELVSETAATALADAISGAIEDQGDFIKSMVLQMFALFNPDYQEGDDPSSVPLNDSVKRFINACYYGPEPGTQAHSYEYDAETARSLIFLMISYIMPDSPVSSETTLSETVTAIMEMMLSVKNEEGEVIGKYSGLEDAANKELLNVLTPILAGAAEDTRTRFGEEYYNDVLKHLDGLNTYIDQIRRIISYLVLFNEGERFDAEAAIENAATFVKNVGIIPVAHYNEVYVAWMKAFYNSDCSNDCKHDTDRTEEKPIDKPVDPMNPNTPAKPDAPKKAPDAPGSITAPNSGDSSDLFTWGLLMTISLLGVIVGIKKRA